MTVYNGTPGNDSFDGTTGDDLFKLSSGGIDTANGEGGNDTFYFGRAFDGSDQIDGGDGFDVLQLQGDYTWGAFITLANTTNLEDVELSGHKRFYFQLADLTFNSSAHLLIDGRAVASSGAVSVHAQAVTHATLTLLGGKGDDGLFGGSMGDRLYGGLGQDELLGDDNASPAPSSADRFIYKSVAESTVERPDEVFWDPASGDRIDLRKIDADAIAAGNQAFHFIGEANFSGTAGELRYQPINQTYLVTADVNGDGVADFAIITQANNDTLPASLVAGDFML